jgi:Holliday junction resolvasome RuvABC ATP-dependent DNA helicase subunit
MADPIDLALQRLARAARDTWDTADIVRRIEEIRDMRKDQALKYERAQLALLREQVANMKLQRLCDQHQIKADGVCP